MKSSKFFLAIILLSTSANAYEVDNFSQRYRPLKDSRETMNNEVNKAFQLASIKLQSSSKGCDPVLLERTMEGHLCGSTIGKFEKYADNSKKVKRHEAAKVNIYSSRRAESVLSGFMMSLAGLGSSVNVDGQYIGADKFGHFFDQGFEYYEIVNKNLDSKVGIEAALNYGIELEDGYYGMETTGIKSYADLSANYSGLKFWMSLYKGADPYFKCIDNKWSQVRNFDFAEYVTPAWDEGVNCSEFEEGIGEAVTNRSKHLESRANKRGKNQKYSCPISPKDCIKLKSIYRDKASKLLGPKCLSAEPNFDQEKISGQVSSQELGESTYKSQNPELGEKESRGAK